MSGFLRYTPRRLGGTTSNLLAPPESGRWFNPPHVWTACDVLFPFFFMIGDPAFMNLVIYGCWYLPMFSHYQDKNYYQKLPYTKEFIKKYNRLERWRHY